MRERGRERERKIYREVFLKIDMQCNVDLLIMVILV